MKTGTHTDLSIVSCLLAFAVASSAAFFVSTPSDAAARYFGLHAMDCHPGGNVALSASDFSMENTGISPSGLHCAVPDTDTLPKYELTSINVYGRDGSTSDKPYSKVCVTFYNTSGGSCGAYTSGSIGGTGYFGLSPSLTAIYNYPSHYAYVRVELPAKQGASTSAFAGFDGLD